MTLPWIPPRINDGPVKKNKKTYLLLGVVLTIWGVLGVKIIGALRPTETTPAMGAVVFKATPVTIQKRDTFRISGDYRDPFLGTLPKAETPKKKQPSRPKVTLPRKQISYLGSIAQNGSNNRMFFVTIDGQQYLMSKAEKINEVTLVWGNAESIRVKYPGHTETIAVQQ